MKTKCWLVIGFGLALRGVMYKRKIGYTVLYRDFDNKCYSQWTLLKPGVVERD